MLKNDAVAEFFNNFEVFWDHGKELFWVLYIASQTNQYKDEIEVNVGLIYA